MLWSDRVGSKTKDKLGDVTPGQRVRAERNRQQLSQEELADRAHVHVNTIRTIEADRTSKYLTARGWKTVSDVAAALGYVPDAFGYRRKRFGRNKPLSSAQLEAIEEVLALSPNQLAKILKLLRTREEADVNNDRSVRRRKA